VCVDQEASDGGGEGEGSEGVHEEKSGEPSMKRERERERERESELVVELGCLVNRPWAVVVLICAPCCRRRSGKWEAQ
jgi:hypothetical protein